MKGQTACNTLCGKQKKTNSEQKRGLRPPPPPVLYAGGSGLPASSFCSSATGLSRTDSGLASGLAGESFPFPDEHRRNKFGFYCAIRKFGSLLLFKTGSTLLNSTRVRLDRFDSNLIRLLHDSTQLSSGRLWLDSAPTRLDSTPTHLDFDTTRL